jgi:hypothetical protein
MNAWGDEPLFQLASAVRKRHGYRSPTSKRAPSDSDLDNIATIDTELVETDFAPTDPGPPAQRAKVIA